MVVISIIVTGSVVIITKTDDHVMHNECPALLNNNRQHITSYLQKVSLHPILIITPTRTHANIHVIVVQIAKEMNLTIKLVR